jgi:signal transduction histidine kinase
VGDVRPPDGSPTASRAPASRPPDARSADPRIPRPTVPRSFQTRLTFAFIGVVALTLALVAPIVVNRLDDYFRQQEEQSLLVRARATAAVIDQFIETTLPNERIVADVDGEAALNPRVQEILIAHELLQSAANNVAQADVTLEFGLAKPDTDGTMVTDPDRDLSFSTRLDIEPSRGQARDPQVAAASAELVATSDAPWGVVVTLSNPYTSRASTLAAISGLLLVMAGIAFLVAVLVAAFLARRFTIPLTRLTEASRRLAEGDLSSRVTTDEVSSSTTELRELSRQFNTMADRLEQSVAIIRRDRDYSRDFLADVSHELRTPIAAMRTFIELLQGPAGKDPEARVEFLDSSAVQLERLDWLAQNLLELSKLDSGLVLLDLRPDDVRGTIESAVEQQQAAAERKGIRLTTTLPSRPLRIRHDPPRLGQVISNLVGNAVKFTEHGRIDVTAHQLEDGGAEIEVVDTGVGIAESELPMIFDRFYRGSGANEARGTGSGLGLAIVKSIVDMHHGTIEVESRVGHGSRFVVRLPRDPREVPDPPAAAPTPVDPASGNVDESSPSAGPPMNPDPAPLFTVPARPDGGPAQPERRSPLS